MIKKGHESEILARLRAINSRIRWIANEEDRATKPGVSGEAATGIYMQEKMTLLDESDKLLAEWENLPND